MHPRVLVTTTLLAITALLVWAIVNELSTVQPRIAAVAKPTASQTGSTGAEGVAPHAVPPLDTFSEIALRPLFSPTRRPPEAVEASPEPVTEVEQPAPEPVPATTPVVTVYGIVENTKERVALISIDGQALRWVREGELLDTWTVERIGEDSVTLSNLGQFLVFELSFWGNALQP